MAHVLLHLNVSVDNAIAEQDEDKAVEAAKRKVISVCQSDLVDLPDEFDGLVALAEVVDFDDD